MAYSRLAASWHSNCIKAAALSLTALLGKSSKQFACTVKMGNAQPQHYNDWPNTEGVRS
jgi:hypothetical protein